MNPDNGKSAGLRRNIELKARCRDLAEARDAAMALGASPAALLRQHDTYFHVQSGRLKLRQIEGKSAELIWYARADSTDLRGSDYYVIPITQFEQTLAALTAALGVRGEVRKSRQLLLWHNVRVHLDVVEELGSFIEFEAVVSADADEAISRQRLATLRDALRIQPADLIAVSYSDLLGI